MSLSDRISASTLETLGQASALAARAAEFARAGADRAAGQVAAAQAPVEVLTEASLKLNTLSHQYLSRLLARQGAMLKGTLAEGEQRLQRLAAAGSLQQAIAAQAEDLDQIRSKVAHNARETWQIVAEAGREVAALATTTYARLVQAAPTATRRAPRPSGPARARTKAARKPATRRRRAA
jgi:phasin family protein